MRLLHRRLLFPALLIVAGCSGPSDPLSAWERRDLIRARAQWVTSDVRNGYRFEVRQSCFCPVEFTRWSTVTVVNGVVVDVRAADGAVVPSTQFAYYVTVDKLFAFLDGAWDDDLDDIVVRFDATYGYPLETSTYYNARVADGGGSTYTRNLVGLPVTIASSAADGR